MATGARIARTIQEWIDSIPDSLYPSHSGRERPGGENTGATTDDRPPIDPTGHHPPTAKIEG